jgi:antitoxin (DNA-binding transcriptional repressor) of toxin-antitoxin stability system
MIQITQTQLRNETSDVLGRAEQGERFSITVGGRPVAETPTDAAWAAELAGLRDADAVCDPWAQ